MAKALILSLLMVVALPTFVRAQQSGGADEMAERLAEGLAKFSELAYEDTIRTLGSVHRDPRATRSQKLSALELIAISSLILGDETRAKEAFEDLLAIDPGYQLRHDDGSPKIRDFYNRVKQSYVPGFDPNARVQLELGAPVGATAGRRLEVETRVLSGKAQVLEIIVKWRRRGVLGYSEAPMRRGDGDLWRARFGLPASAAAYVIDYYIEARGPAGASIGRVGGPETPLGLTVAAGSASGGRSWYQRWYVVAGGAAVLGGVTAALLLSRDDSAPSGSLAPGRVTLSE